MNAVDLVFWWPLVLVISILAGTVIASGLIVLALLGFKSS